MVKGPCNSTKKYLNTKLDFGIIIITNCIGPVAQLKVLEYKFGITVITNSRVPETQLKVLEYQTRLWYNCFYK